MQFSLWCWIEAVTGAAQSRSWSAELAWLCVSLQPWHAPRYTNQAHHHTITLGLVVETVRHAKVVFQSNGRQWGYNLQLPELFVTNMNQNMVVCILLLQLVLVCVPALSAKHSKSEHVNKQHYISTSRVVLLVLVTSVNTSSTIRYFTIFTFFCLFFASVETLCFPMQFSWLNLSRSKLCLSAKTEAAKK